MVAELLTFIGFRPYAVDLPPLALLATSALISGFAAFMAHSAILPFGDPTCVEAWDHPYKIACHPSR